MDITDMIKLIKEQRNDAYNNFMTAKSYGEELYQEGRMDALADLLEENKESKNKYICYYCLIPINFDDDSYCNIHAVEGLRRFHLGCYTLYKRNLYA